MTDIAFRTLTIVQDCDANECLYVGQSRYDRWRNDTIYACDIAEAAEDQPVVIHEIQIKEVLDEWPETLEELLGSCGLRQQLLDI